MILSQNVYPNNWTPPISTNASSQYRQALNNVRQSEPQFLPSILDAIPASRPSRLRESAHTEYISPSPFITPNCTSKNHHNQPCIASQLGHTLVSTNLHHSSTGDTSPVSLGGHTFTGRSDDHWRRSPSRSKQPQVFDGRNFRGYHWPHPYIDNSLPSTRKSPTIPQMSSEFSSRSYEPHITHQEHREGIGASHNRPVVDWLDHWGYQSAFNGLASHSRNILNFTELYIGHRSHQGLYPKHLPSENELDNMRTIISDLTLSLEYIRGVVQSATWYKQQRNSIPDLKNMRRSMLPRICYNCQRTKAPGWRRGPRGAGTLCNACSLRYAKLERRS